MLRCQSEQPSTSSPVPKEDYWKHLSSQSTEAILNEALKANPNDVDLCIAYISSYAEPPAVIGTGAGAIQPPSRALADEIASRLLLLQDDGRAQLAVYGHLWRQSDKTPAQEFLEEAAARAIERLVDHAEQNPDEQDGTGNAGQSADNLLAEEGYEPAWDWQLALLAVSSATNDQQAAYVESLYAELLPLAGTASSSQSEQLFVMAGQFYWGRDNRERAVEIWQTGVEALAGNVTLSLLLTQAALSMNDLETAETQLAELNNSISDELLRLSGPAGIRMTFDQKSARRKTLELAAWEAKVLEGQTLALKEDYRAASDALAEAFDSPALVTQDNRLRAGVLLAENYGALELWDLAGQTFDRCVNLTPNDPVLRRAAANAWQQAGSTERASEQLARLDDGTWQAALEMARLRIQGDVLRAEEVQGDASVREVLAEARRRFDALPAEQRSLNPEWRLELFETLYAGQGDPSLAQWKKLAAKYPDVGEVQMVWLNYLAQAGDLNGAQSALDRLQSIADREGRPADSANVILAEATLALAAEELDEALDILRRGIQTIPEQALDLALQAANVALRNEQPKVAYDFLSRLPEESLNVAALMALSRIAAISQAGDVGIEVDDADFARWENRLKDIEGEQGSHWRFVAGQHRLSQAARSDAPEPLLAQAERLFQEIVKRRPQWGLAASLGGRIAAMRGDHELAVQRLQRAIRDGDNQISTGLVLVSELNALNRIGDAEKELQRISALTDSVAQVAFWEISLANRQGDVDRVLELARAEASRRPEDWKSWLLVFQASMKLAVSLEPDSEQAQQLKAEALRAIEQAHELSGGKQVVVWDAQFRFHLAAGDREQAEKQLVNMQSSDLPSFDAKMAAARGYLQLNDLASAEKLAKTAMGVNPDRYEPHVELANVYRRLGDRPAMIAELKSAYSLDPDNTQLREALAMAYASSPTDIPWGEIENLLQQNTNDSSRRMDLLRSGLYLQQGTDERKQAGLSTLREIASSTDPEAPVAKRLLAKHFADKWLALPDEKRAANSSFDEAESYYKSLVRVADAEPQDLAAFARLLLEKDRLDEAERLINRLLEGDQISLAGLQLKLQLAERQGDDVQQVTSAWIERVSRQGDSDIEQLWLLVSRLQWDLNFKNESMVWLGKAYESDPDKYFAEYVLRKSQMGEVAQAIEMCLKRYLETPDVATATLLGEVAMRDPSYAESDRVQKALASALASYPESAGLLEAVATLRMSQERYMESVALYELAEKLDPNRVRTLNNLAISMAELPTRRNEAPAKVDRAIKLYGRAPELLDTMALVQAKLGKHEDAVRLLEEAIETSSDPRFKIHLVELYLEQNDQVSARRVWEQVDLANLDKMSMFPAELRTIQALEKKFSG